MANLLAQTALISRAGVSSVDIATSDAIEYTNLVQADGGTIASFNAIRNHFAELLENSAYYNASFTLPQGSGYKASTLYYWLPQTREISAGTASRGGSQGTYIDRNGVLQTAAANVPRWDFSDGFFPKLLREPQRTNILTYSSQFDDASWTKSNGGVGVAPVVTPNATSAPDNTLTADRLDFDAGGLTSSDFSSISKSYSATADPYSSGVFIKAVAASDVGKEIAIRTFGASGFEVFTLTNTWQKIKEENVTPTAGTQTFEIAVRGTITADRQVSAYLWGAQAEKGTYLSSFISTVATVQTRNADLIEKTGIPGLIGDSQGTLLAKFAPFEADGNGLGVALHDGTVNNRVTIAKNSLVTPVLGIVTVGGASQASISGSSYADNTDIKIAFGYATNNFAAYVNGSSIGTDSSGNTFSEGTLNTFSFTVGATAAPLYGKISSVTHWQTRLINSTLLNLSS